MLNVAKELLLHLSSYLNLHVRTSVQYAQFQNVQKCSLSNHKQYLLKLRSLDHKEFHYSIKSWWFWKEEMQMAVFLAPLELFPNMILLHFWQVSRAAQVQKIHQTKFASLIKIPSFENQTGAKSRLSFILVSSG